VGDVERILARLALRSARPRDLARLCDSLTLWPTLRSLPPIENPRLAQRDSALAEYPETVALVDNSPVIIRKGGVTSTGFDTELDELRAIREKHQR
jgi:DNA mismatch repair protein MutS